MKRELKSVVPPLLSDQLRQIIRDAPVSRYQISKATGIANSTLSKFLSGEREGFAPWNLDELGKFLRLTITSAGALESEHQHGKRGE